MKIIYVAGSKIPSREANSIQVMKMCQAFLREGHDIKLIIQKPYKGDINYSLLWQQYGIITPFLIEYIAVPLNIHPILKNIIFVFKSLKIIREENPNLAYTRFLPAGALISKLQLPFIYESHSFQYRNRLSPLYIHSILQSNNLLRLVVITEALRKEFLENYGNVLSSDKIIVAPDAVDLERYSNVLSSDKAKGKLGIPSQTFVAGYSGNLYSGRGINLIIKLADLMPDIHFLIMGGNEDDIDKYRYCIKSKNLKNIQLLGFIPNIELPNFLAACDILLMPHQKKVEVAGGGGDISLWTSPMKMFEYMATERLIISSDLPVLREVLTTDNSVLCNPEDIGTWQQMIRRAQNDKGWRERLARQARIDVEQYSWNNRVRNVLSGFLL